MSIFTKYACIYTCIYILQVEDLETVLHRREADMEAVVIKLQCVEEKCEVSLKSL